MDREPPISKTSEILESDIDDCDVEGPMTPKGSLALDNDKPPDPTIERFSHSMTILRIVPLTSITSIQHKRVGRGNNSRMYFALRARHDTNDSSRNSPFHECVKKIQLVPAREKLGGT